MYCLCACLSSIAAATAAKLLQSCPTLCNPIDGSPPGSPVPGILQARTLEQIQNFSSVQLLSCVQLLATPWNAVRQASISITNSQSFVKLMSIEWWYHPNISSSVVPFSSCLQSFPASGSFPRSQFFTSGGQTIGVSASASALLIAYNEQCWIYDFRRRRFGFGIRDQAWSLKSFCGAELY